MKIKFECDTEEEVTAAKEFIGWLSNSGEQSYWDQMQITEYDYEDDEDVTIINFNYDPTFLGEDDLNPEIECKLGRLTKGDM